MRLTLFSILAALLLVTATARRGSKETPALPVSKKHTLVPQWGFPYGWGLGPGIDSQEFVGTDEKGKEMKEVKRGTSNPIESRVAAVVIVVLKRSISHTIHRFTLWPSYQNEEGL
jgi:hypothetical protein